MAKSKIILIKGTEITISIRGEKDYISLTDIAKYRNTVEPFSVINNWMRTKSTIDFIGLWEKLNNPSFKPIEFERFRNEADNNYFILFTQIMLRKIFAWIDENYFHEDSKFPAFHTGSLQGNAGAIYKLKKQNRELIRFAD